MTSRNASCQSSLFQRLMKPGNSAVSWRLVYGSNQDNKLCQDSFGDDQDSHTRDSDSSNPTAQTGSHQPPLANDKKKRRAFRPSLASLIVKEAPSGLSRQPMCVKRYPPSALSALIFSLVSINDLSSTFHSLKVRSTYSMACIVVPFFSIDRRMPWRSTKLNR